jgi:CheY-like chemotaxis protein/DNA-directed RNA polymerase specialized sigma24 family protein
MVSSNAPHNAPDLATTIGENLPYLRRYARALTGSQTSGDRYAAATLEAILAGSAEITAGLSIKVALFHAFHMVWSSAGAPVGEPDSLLSARAQEHMADLTPNSREALLLHAIEGFTNDEIGSIMNLTSDEVAEFIDIARREMENSVAGDILVIEDEAIIALDIAGIVTDVGHRVTGIARTRAEAVRLAAEQRPNLILADIQLADNSSGIDAVNDILTQFEDVPVIFITAFSERLLTGQRPEPAFLITKPFTEEQLRSAVSQAMFFSSTETLAA